MSQIQLILKQNQLRLTKCREEVLGFLVKQNYAITHAELETHFPEFDRVTLYRTLDTFLQKGLLHKVMDGSGVTKFAACAETCNEHHHHDEHIHFQCIKCEQTRCIDTVEIPKVNLPQGFKFIESNLLIKGVCDKC